MTQKEGIRNYSLNIRDSMLKIQEATNKNKVAKLTTSEQYSILNFYLEVVDYLSR